MKDIQKNIDYRKLKIRGGNNVDYDFSDYKTFKELFRDLYYKKITIDDAESKQDEITGVMGALKGYAPRDNKYIELKNKLVNNVENFYKGREKIIKGFKNKIFPVYYDEAYEHQLKAQKRTEEEEKEQKRRKMRARKEKQEEIFPKNFDDKDIQKEQDKPPSLDEVIKSIINKEGLYINDELFKQCFKVENPNLMYKVLSETNNKEKNNKLVNIFNSGLKVLENEIKYMSKKERKTKKPNSIVTVVKKILDFNKHAQKGQGLKILIPKQMLNRLPIVLAQLQAGNNSNKQNSEIRQLLYSLYRSKNMTEQVYKSLISII